MGPLLARIRPDRNQSSLLQGHHDMKLRIAVQPRGERTPPVTSRYADIRRPREKAFTVHLIYILTSPASRGTAFQS